MSDDKIIKTTDSGLYFSYKPPVYTWVCYLFGTGTKTSFKVEDKDVPNWFWRKMQYLILGNKWEKL